MGAVFFCFFCLAEEISTIRSGAHGLEDVQAVYAGSARTAETFFCTCKAANKLWSEVVGYGRASQDFVFKPPRY